MAIAISTTKHATAFPSKVLAREGGKHIFNIKASSAIDNGNLVARDNYISLDLYGEKAPTSFAGVIREQAANGNWYVEVTAETDALLCYTLPMNPYENPKSLAGQELFYVATGEIARCYELAVGDIFEVSKEAFSGTPAAGKTITTITAKKMVVSNS